MHTFALDLFTADGQRLGAVALEKADFTRAVEACFFTALRQGRFANYAVPQEEVRVEPVVRQLAPGRHTDAFEVVLPLPGGAEQRTRFGLDFFKGLVRRSAVPLVAAGRLAEDSALVYLLRAEPGEPQRRAPGGLALELEAEAPAIPIRPGRRRGHGLAQAWDGPRASDFPVLLPRHVIDEAVAEARRAPEREVGGVLLGHLRRDEEDGALYLEVTCLVPAEDTQATGLSVTFTHSTWARVREVAQWRGAGELIVGWVHSHPFRLCAECPAPVPAECQAKVLFYSADDEFLMETTFARPFMVGLLAAVEPRLETALGHAPVKLFGWRDGVIASRGFEVIA
jgi:proteasome lid subunit RPN8/RPN11